MIGSAMSRGVVPDKRLDVSGILDLRAMAVTAPVAGEHLCALDDAYLSCESGFSDTGKRF